MWRRQIQSIFRARHCAGVCGLFLVYLLELAGVMVLLVEVPVGGVPVVLRPKVKMGGGVVWIGVESRVVSGSAFKLFCGA